LDVELNFTSVQHPKLDGATPFGALVIGFKVV